jgi:hypothetical protein
MAKKHESKWNIEDLTDREIYDAIRYLEPTSLRGTKESEDSSVVICVSIVMLLLGCFGVILLYWK